MSAKAGSLPVLGEKHWWQILMRGIIALIFGILVLGWPGISLFILAIAFGAYVFVDGIFTLVAAVKYKAGAGRCTWLFIRGIAGIVVGLITLFWPLITELVLVILIAAWALVTGVMELVFAFQANRDTAIRWMFAISGILSIILGVLIIAKPIFGALVIAWVIGAYAVLAGIVLIILSFRLRSVGAMIKMETKQQKPKWKKIVGWILFIWGIGGVVFEIVGFLLWGVSPLWLWRLGVSGLLIWGGYNLKK